MSVLSPTVITYIVEQVRQQEKEAEVSPGVIKPYTAWIESLPFHPKFKMSGLKYLTGRETPISRLLVSCPDACYS